MIEKLELHTKHGALKIINDPNFQISSVDNLYSYDRIYGMTNNVSTQFGIFTSNDSILLSNSGGISGLHDNCYLLEDDFLFLCVGNSIFSLAIPNLELRWQSQVDTFSCFGIYKIADGFIVHGELEITRINTTGKIIWQHSGSDIFTTSDGIDTFKIENNIIYAKSWDNRLYQFTLSGEILM
ncbi:hypothetical protein EHQ53_12255 [Leptospira langatensis]|uniref:Uncharacterized protein n=1 Tax=Leptospira langatensis TaxID=2484983 RepID=A0A5F1ZS45_9LEPT|nr:hypothetical protein [Leptospira langatensis]TGJ98687.1 hypothetical protein EHO57_14250 [Leptospira langatensis]TGL40747.1 hypothetical protein EHQ53_12255 [Leptospira langatensis]